MKMGVISDIHGDLRALDQALLMLRMRHAVDVIWCAGDLVGRGKQPNEVVARLTVDSIPAVLGNHDELVLMLLRQHPPTHPDDMVLGYRTETVRRLRLLPRTYRRRIAGKNIVMVHGTPRSNSESISLMPANQGRALGWLEKIGANILITGHTHVPYFVQDQRGLVVNPGSLFDASGMTRSSSETYGVLDLDTPSFEIYRLWE